MRGNKMLEWKVEDMRLREEAINENLKWSSYEVFKNTYSTPYIFKCENAISKEEKIKFVDEMTNGKLSYVINLVNKFDNEKETLPKDSYGLDKRNIVQVVKSYEGFSLCTYDKNGSQRKLSLEELKEVKQDFDEIDAFMETLAQKRQKSYEHDNLNIRHKKQEDFSR